MIENLEKCPLFRGISAEKIASLLSDDCYTISKYRDNDVIAQRDTAYSSLIIILEGSVHGQVKDSLGNVVSVDSICSPNLISPAFLFGGYNKLPIDVISEGDTTVVQIHRALLFEMMQKNVVIMSNFIDIISNRADVLNRKLFYLSFKSLRNKVIEYMMAGGKTKAEITDYFKVTPDGIDRILGDLTRVSAIEINDRSEIIIKDIDKLKRCLKR